MLEAYLALITEDLSKGYRQKKGKPIQVLKHWNLAVQRGDVIG